jgi:Protein of unknown function (DUF3617)
MRVASWCLGLCSCLNVWLDESQNQEDEMQRSIQLSVILSCATLLFAAGTYQPLNVKPGLWQVTEVSTVGGAPPITPAMQARLNKMTPEQRAHVEAMMKSRFGGTPRTTQYKKCVTAKDLNTNAFVNGPGEKCTWNIVNSTGTDMEARGTACEAGKEQGMDTDVDIKLHVVDPENVKATVQGKATGNGQNVNIDNTLTGKWMAASCPAGTD